MALQCGQPISSALLDWYLKCQLVEVVHAATSEPIDISEARATVRLTSAGYSLLWSGEQPERDESENEQIFEAPMSKAQ